MDDHAKKILGDPHAIPPYLEKVLREWHEIAVTYDPHRPDPVVAERARAAWQIVNEACLFWEESCRVGRVLSGPTGTGPR